MSWQKCEKAEYYSLAIPNGVVLFLGFLHLWLGASYFWLDLPADLTVLLCILTLRSWKRVRAQVEKVAQLELQVEEKGRFYIHECSRRLECRKRSSVEPGDCIRRLRFSDFLMNEMAETVVTKRQGQNDSCVSQQYTCCRSVKVPGCVHLTLVSKSAKPLEILVFYRYYQRQFYRRLLRQLAIQ